jgi:glycosyltransferase involved in cell wall biosynthesis
MPLVSIITVNLNNCSGLEKTILSAAHQSFRNYEHIVIDGGSSDRSVEVIQSFTSLLPGIYAPQKDHSLSAVRSVISAPGSQLPASSTISYWVSEPDSGIYNAMNKGILHAQGKYCLFLNSGDWLADEHVLEKVFSEPRDADVISGDIAFYDNVKQSVRWMVPSPEALTAKTLFNGTLPHQATFIKRELFEKYGLYNEDLKIASDWLFFVEVLLVHNVTYMHYNGLVSYFSMDGISCNPETNDLPEKEKLMILRQKYPRFISDYDRLRQLEEDDKAWKGSREFRVIGIFRKTGIIRIGVLFLRAANFIKRLRTVSG